MSKMKKEWKLQIPRFDEKHLPILLAAACAWSLANFVGSMMFCGEGSRYPW
jgi:hypothetical protein